jgi:hypothetical protein
MHTRNILSNYFNIFEMHLKCTFIIGAFAPMSQNSMSPYIYVCSLSSLTYVYVQESGREDCIDIILKKKEHEWTCDFLMCTQEIYKVRPAKNFTFCLPEFLRYDNILKAQLKF